MVRSLVENDYDGLAAHNFLFHSPVTRTGNCFEITLELSCCKYPASNRLKTEWDNNRESMLKYTEEIHKGIKGFVMDGEGKPIVGENSQKLGVVKHGSQMGYD